MDYFRYPIHPLNDRNTSTQPPQAIQWHPYIPIKEHDSYPLKLI